MLTSVNVIEEVTYVLIKEKAKDSTYNLLNYLKENPKVVSEVVILTDLLNFYNISVYLLQTIPQCSKS